MSNKELLITDEEFTIGLSDVISHLSSELREFLVIEKRYFGITKSYLNSINTALIKIESKQDEDESSLCRRLLNTFKPIIMKEFKRLRAKKLSSGDCCTVIVLKLLSIIEKMEININVKELNTIKKIYKKLFDNIKNRSKYDAQYNFTNEINQVINTRSISFYESYLLNLVELEIEKKITDLEPSTVVDEWGETKLVEITWKN